jgi:hypothetical protein
MIFLLFINILIINYGNTKAKILELKSALDRFL